tara:strand:+ start:1893 stop:2108 length:216 start_codon:yes stop_codon:yes gene_type:complete
MKIPFFHDHKAKREQLGTGDLFHHCDQLLGHLTLKERDQYRRYLTNEFKRGRDARRNETSFRNNYKPGGSF